MSRLPQEDPYLASENGYAVQEPCAITEAAG
jgi:hypothetical protein